jgi:translation initiation factor 2 beta subunit (eIF-2beta)/eIF-5
MTNYNEIPEFLERPITWFRISGPTTVSGLINNYNDIPEFLERSNTWSRISETITDFLYDELQRNSRISGAAKHLVQNFWTKKGISV